jgi:hypothetical protein
LDNNEVAPAPRLAAGPAEMLAAARPVLSGRSYARTRGRHRKPSQIGGSWLRLAARILEEWARTLRVCLLLVATGAVVTAAILSTGLAIGASVGTFVAGLGLVAAWTARAPRAPKSQL